MATELGVRIRTKAKVTGVSARPTRAQFGRSRAHAVSGVVLEGGEEIAANVVISNR